MGICRLYRIESFHTLGPLESEWRKVAALNLFHPTASPPFEKVSFFNITGQSYFGESSGQTL
jgi:hypothetical protein